MTSGETQMTTTGTTTTASSTSPNVLVVDDENFEISLTCCRPLLHIFRGDEWLILAESLSIEDDELHSRLEQYWTTVASISGLIAGFTYIISNTEIEFTREIWFEDHERHNIFGFLTIQI